MPQDHLFFSFPLPLLLVINVISHLVFLTQLGSCLAALFASKDIKSASGQVRHWEGSSTCKQSTNCICLEFGEYLLSDLARRLPVFAREPFLSVTMVDT